MKVYRDRRGYEYWYDRQWRVWLAAKVDSGGNLSNTIQAYTKREIMDMIDRGYLDG